MKKWLIGVPVAVVLTVGSLIIGLLVWVGSVASSIACIGIGDIIPQITETVSGQGQPAPGFEGNNQQLFDTVDRLAAGNTRLIAAMYFGSYMESGRRNDASDGAAFGPWQIQSPGVVHKDITVQQAEDPVYSTTYMYPRYLAALNRVDPSRWLTDAKGAAEQTAFIAEGPSVIYTEGQGADKVQAAWTNTLKFMQLKKHDTTFAAGSSQPTTNEVSTVSGLSSNTCSGGGLLGSVLGAALGTGDIPSIIKAVTDLLGGSAADTAQKRLDVVKRALSWVGTPYSWAAGNAQGPTLGKCGSGAASNDCNIKGFDCSGLVLYAYAPYIEFEHLAASQYDNTKDRTVQLSAAQPGDLVFFTGSDGTFARPGHVGIYLGKGQMVNAPQSGEDVKIVNITTGYWQDTFIAVTSPLG